MKKPMIFLSLFTLVLCYANASGIKVFKPAANEIIYKGADYNIRWQVITKTLKPVKIRLLDSSATIKILEITNSTANDGQFWWKKHSIDGVKPGTYVIRVKTIDNLVGGDSKPFKIENKKGPNIGIIDVESLQKIGFIINNPRRNNRWKTGKSYEIRWTKLVKMGPKVRLSYFPEGQPHLADAGQDIVINSWAPNSGGFQWKIPDTARTGHVQIRIRTLDSKYKADSEPFFIESAGKPHRHRAPAIGAPSGASFTIKRILVNYFKPGVIDKVVIQINYNSKTAFSFDKYKGHPQHGPAYLNCKIINPIWPEHHKWSHLPAEKGPPTPKVIYNHRLSVKYGGKQHLHYAPHIMDPGHGMFELVFGPKHAGKLLGLHTLKNMAGAGFSTPDVCRHYYSPKLQVRVFIHTKEGIKTLYKQWYLNNAPKRMFKIGGTVNTCSGGYVLW